MNKPAAAVSAGLHVVGLVCLLLLPRGPRTEERLSTRFQQSARLIAPPTALTQRPANRIQPRKEINLEALLARRSAVTAPKTIAPKPVTQEPAPVPAAPSPPPPVVQPPILASPPPVEQAPPPPPQRETTEKPKLAFENPGDASVPADRSVSGVLRQPGNASGIRLPGSSLQDAIQEVARNRRGSGQTVGGEITEDTSGIVEARETNQPTIPSASNVELLSDPKGVDFKPYLTQVLAAVRQNWRAVFPESARLGRRGRVVILFSVDRSGRVPKLVISQTSGADALDRAAVAGISASDPFPPLPAEFLGEEIRLQLNFAYNMRQ